MSEEIYSRLCAVFDFDIITKKISLVIKEEQFGEIYTDYKCMMEGTYLFKDEIIKITMLLNDAVEVEE